MSCHKVRRLLAFRREWTVAEARQVDRHLAGCPACQAVARAYELIDRRLDRLPAVPAPATLPAAIRIEAGGWRRPPADQAQAAPRPASQGILLLVAVALLIVAAAVWSTRAPAGPDEAMPISVAMPEGLGVTHPTPAANPPRKEDALVFTYTVRPGDNVWSIARGYGLAPETVMWANPSLERSTDLLSVGDVLTVPVADGVLYRVQTGDTLTALAERYETTVAEIISFGPNNVLDANTLVSNRLILLVGGRKDITTDAYYPLEGVSQPPEGAPQGLGRFAWPAAGVLTQRYWSGHLGIDIANTTGTPIRAADAGYVVLAGRDNWGFGNQVVIDHGNGYLTRYAHLDTMRVRAGDGVDKHQVIGTMGSTGRATGPHLHFEIIYNKVRRDPLGFLPGEEDDVGLGGE